MTMQDALRDLRDGLLDLQAADYNTYARPLRRMAAALEDAELKPIVDALAGAVDFDQFVLGSGSTSGLAGVPASSGPAKGSRNLVSR